MQISGLPVIQQTKSCDIASPPVHTSADDDADLLGGAKRPSEVHVQFIMPDPNEATTTQESSYDLHEDPLPDAEAVFITDLPTNPQFRGCYTDSLQNAFATLNEQIGGALGLCDFDTLSRASDIPATASQQRTVILKNRPSSAVELPTRNVKSKSRAKSANAAKPSNNSRYLLVNRTFNHASEVSCSDAASDVCSAIQMEPVVYSCTTGKQIAGFSIMSISTKFYP